MILVVGATGHLGGLVTRALLDQGKPVRILVRPGTSYDDLVAAGAEPVTGDLKDPDSLSACCAGAEAIVTTANAALRGGDDTVESVDRRGNRDLIDAAAAAGVNHFVFVSALGASPDSPVPFMLAKGEAEQRLRDSGVPWTVLQPNAYMDTWFPMIVGGPALAGQPVTLVGEGATPPLVRRGERRRRLRPGRPRPARRRSDPGHRRPGAGDLVGRHRRVQRRAGPRAVRTERGAGGADPRSARRRRQLLAGLETYDSPIDSSDLARTYGVTPTSPTDFIRGFLAANRPAVG